MTTATNWLLNWALGFATPYLVNYGPGNANLQSKIFFIWFGCCFLCIAFAYFMIYETKGLTLEEVDELYSEVKDARKSKGWKPSVTFVEMTVKAQKLEDKDATEEQHEFDVGHEVSP
jgi:hypothetical protein